jgi:transcriptional regulator with XRE-family HTH domain
MSDFVFDGCAVRRLRRANKLSSTAFGAAINKSPFTVARYENGSVPPSVITVARMASVLGVEPGALFVQLTADERSEVVLT